MKTDRKVALLNEYEKAVEELIDSLKNPTS
jgi:hypothetical protein